MFWFFGHESNGILAHRPGIELSPLALEGEVITTGLPGEVITISWTTRKVPVVCFFKFLPWIFLFMPKLYTDFHYFLHKIIRWEKWHNTKRANMKTHFSVPSFWVSLEAWQGIMFSRLYVYSLPSSFQGSVVGDPFRSLWIQRTIKGSKAVFFLLVVSPSYRSKLQFFQVTTKCQAGNSQSPVLMIFFSDSQPQYLVRKKYTVNFLIHSSFILEKKTIIWCFSLEIKKKKSSFGLQKCLS